MAKAINKKNLTDETVPTIMDSVQPEIANLEQEQYDIENGFDNSEPEIIVEGLTLPEAIVAAIAGSLANNQTLQRYSDYNGYAESVVKFSNALIAKLDQIKFYK